MKLEDLKKIINELNEEDYNISLQVVPSISEIRYSNNKTRKFVRYTRIIEIEDKEEKEVS